MAFRPMTARLVTDLRDIPFGAIVAVHMGLYDHVGILAMHPLWGWSVISFGPTGIIEQPLEDFARGKNLAWWDYPSELSTQDVIWRARMAVANRPYHWHRFNCDYFVRYSHGLPMKSPQANASIALGIMIAGITLAMAAQ